MNDMCSVVTIAINYVQGLKYAQNLHTRNNNESNCPGPRCIYSLLC